MTTNFPETNEEILAAFKLVLPYMNRIVREDMAVGLTDTKAYLGYYRAKAFELDLPEGKSIDNIETVQKCMRTKTETFDDIPPSVYGRPIKTIFTPIYGLNKEVIGTLSSGIDLQYSKARRRTRQGLCRCGRRSAQTCRTIARSGETHPEHTAGNERGGCGY